jgi:hypothetical protein
VWLKKMNEKENERLGLGLNLIEALNIFLFQKDKISFRMTWVHVKIQHVVNLMDEVLA